MWNITTALVLALALALPARASAGPLAEAAVKAARDLGRTAAQEQSPGRGRFWTGIALLIGGGTLAALSGLEFGDDETGPDDGEDSDNSDDGEDSDGWGGKAMLGAGSRPQRWGRFSRSPGESPGPRYPCSPVA